MKRASEGSLLSTVFVDYDNIYLSLKRKSEEAAKRFAKDAGLWLAEIASGRLITPTNSPVLSTPRRIVMNRCYGNPVPRRNSHDNSTDMNSFPFVRHHFLRAGFEVIDCPPLTAQLKNSADIRMVMDVRDYLLHDTYFDEFIILSGDADFTPVLHRLRQHARRTVIYSNDYTAAPYTAISDGEVREADLIAVLTEGRIPSAISDEPSARKGLPSPASLAEGRKAILADVLGHVRSENQPLLLEVLADRAVRALGHEKTVGTGWGGAGSFRDLLVNELPEGVEVTEHAPYYVLDTRRQSVPAEAKSDPGDPRPQRETMERFTHSFGDIRPEPLVPARQPAQQLAQQPAPAAAGREEAPQPYQAPQPNQRAIPPIERQEVALREPETHQTQARAPATQAPLQRQPEPFAPQQEPRFAPYASPEAHTNAPQAPAHQAPQAPAHRPPAHQPPTQQVPAANGAPAPQRPQHPPLAQRPAHQPDTPEPPQKSAPQSAAPRTSSSNASAIQKSIARIHEACQAPPISPPEYRVLFEVMAEEINANGLTGAQTLVNICERAKALGVEVRKDDARFVLEVVSEADPWFEQGASTSLFASRFRNFVIARCKGQGLQLSATELDLIEAWFTGAAPRVAAHKESSQAPQAQPSGQSPSAPSSAPSHGASPAHGAPAAHGAAQPQPRTGTGPDNQGAGWFGTDPQSQGAAYQTAEPPDFGHYSESSDDFPRVLRNRNRA
jgi:NYN domain